MNQRVAVFYIIGVLSIVYSFSLIPPLAVSAWLHDGEFNGFELTFLTSLLGGCLLWALTRRRDFVLRRRDGILVVAIFWVYLSVISALPLMLDPQNQLGFVDSLFEATSGITTTGATVIPDLARVAPSILFYRQELQWFGGMGLIVLAIAVLPMLGVGGAQLYRVETPGAMKDERLTPRLKHTARNLWLIYVLLTIVCATAYWTAGLAPLDALEHSFSTVSTGGFSTHNESLAFYHSTAVNYIAVIFMVLGGINFGIHFMVLHKRNPLLYIIDTEVRTFLGLLALFVVIYTGFLYFTHVYLSFSESFENSLFEVTSVITSTGFGITDFSLWPVFLPALLIFISFIGGCGGSTAGGIKVMRIMLLIKQGLYEMFMLVHPKAVRPVRIGRRTLNEHIIQAVWGFFALYIFTFVLLTILMMMTGLDQVSAFSAVAACINNLGPGLGKVSATFAEVNEAGKLIGIFAMLLGRLEIFTVLILFLPEFWKS